MRESESKSESEREERVKFRDERASLKVRERVERVRVSERES